MSMIENYDARFTKLERKLSAAVRRIKALEGDAPAKAPAKKAPAKRVTSAVKKTATRGRPRTTTAGR